MRLSWSGRGIDDDDDLPMIQLPPERMVLRGFDENRNPIMDVLQPDGTYKPVTFMVTDDDT